jgi:hypothetical protein
VHWQLQQTSAALADEAMQQLLKVDKVEGERLINAGEITNLAINQSGSNTGVRFKCISLTSRN